MRYAVIGGLLFLGIVWGSFVAFAGLSAALICIARDRGSCSRCATFRVGVLVMILIMPISAKTTSFPRAICSA
jgi:hypothetical protein